jgi:predicted component of type VI protein secretion system
MEAKLYQMPFVFGDLMQRGRELPAVNLGTSIAQNVFLIVSTKYKEHRFDAEYGCEIWERDFETIVSPLVWQEEINRSIRKCLARYEPRLENVVVDTQIEEQEYVHPTTKIRGIKKRVTANVRGVIKSTGENFACSPKLFISPISLD